MPIIFCIIIVVFCKKRKKQKKTQNRTGKKIVCVIYIHDLKFALFFVPLYVCWTAKRQIGCFFREYYVAALSAVYIYIGRVWKMHASNVHIFDFFYISHFHNNNLTSIMLYFLTRFSSNKKSKKKVVLTRQ